MADRIERAAAPSFTVVMPCYNGAAYLAEALRSALAQTYPVAEILVIDDGSSDDSRAIAASFAPKVVCLSQSHQGPSAARNLGADRAEGTFVAFLDADDVWLPDKLEGQARLIEASPADQEIGLVYTGLHRLYPDGSLVETLAGPPAFTIDRLRFECPILPSTVVARTELVRQVRWSEAFGSSEDWDFFYRLSRRCRFGFIERSTTYYRQHAASLSTRDFRAVLDNARRVSASIQRDAHGLDGWRRGRVVDARLLVSAAIAAREQGARESVPYLVQSLLAWPLPLPSSSSSSSSSSSRRGRGRVRMLGNLLLRRRQGG